MRDQLASLFEQLNALMDLGDDTGSGPPANPGSHDAPDVRFRPANDLADQVFRARAELDRSIASLERILAQPSASTPDIEAALGRVDEAREQVRTTIREHAPRVLLELSRSIALTLQPPDPDDVTFERACARTASMLASLRGVTLATNELERLMMLLRSRPERGEPDRGTAACSTNSTEFEASGGSGRHIGALALAGYAHCHDPDGLHLVLDAGSGLSETCLRIGRTTAAIFDLLGVELPKDFAVYGLTEARLPQPDTFEAAAANLQAQIQRLSDANQSLADSPHGGHGQSAPGVPESLAELCGGLHALEHLSDVCLPELIFGVVLAVSRAFEIKTDVPDSIRAARGPARKLAPLLQRARREVVSLRVAVDALIRAALIPPGICPDQGRTAAQAGATMPELSDWIDKLLDFPEP